MVILENGAHRGVRAADYRFPNGSKTATSYHDARENQLFFFGGIGAGAGFFLREAATPTGFGPDIKATRNPPMGVRMMARRNAPQKPIRRVVPNRPIVTTRRTRIPTLRNGANSIED